MLQRDSATTALHLAKVVQTKFSHHFSTSKNFLIHAFEKEILMLKDLTVVLNIAGLGQALILASLLWHSSSRWRTSNRFLALVLLSFAIVIFNTILRLSIYKASFQGYELFANACVMLIAPSLFLYMESRFKESNTARIFLHYIPFLLYSLVLVLLLCLGATYKASVYAWQAMGLVIFHIQFACYLYFTFRLFTRLSNNYSSNAEVKDSTLSWMKRLFTAISIAWSLALIFFLVEAFFHLLPDLLTLNVSLIFVFIIGQLAYKSYRLPNQFIQNGSAQAHELSNGIQLEIEQKLLLALEKDKMYLDPHLNMHDLAKHCQFPARQLSQYLNQYKQVNFFEYINGFRVAHLKALLSSPGSSQYTINALAEQSGFRSISTAYGAFKKQVGKTPAQFKKEQIG